MESFDKHYKEYPETKNYVLLMIIKIIKELHNQSLIIEIEGMTFSVGLDKIKSFLTHIGNLKEFLLSHLGKNTIK